MNFGRFVNTNTSIEQCIQRLLVYGHLFRFQFYCIVSIPYTWYKCIIYRFETVHKCHVYILAIGHFERQQQEIFSATARYTLTAFGIRMSTMYHPVELEICVYHISCQLAMTTIDARVSVAVCVGVYWPNCCSVWTDTRSKYQIIQNTDCVCVARKLSYDDKTCDSVGAQKINEQHE